MKEIDHSLELKSTFILSTESDKIQILRNNRKRCWKENGGI